MIFHRRFTQNLRLHRTLCFSLSTKASRDPLLSFSSSFNLENLNFNTSVASQAQSLPPSNDSNSASKPLRQLLAHISTFCPGTVRRFRRVSVLKPDQALELLTEFQHGCESQPIEPRKVRSLLEIFNQVSHKELGFVRFPAAFQIMASLLLRAGLFIEVENFLSQIGSTADLLNSHEVFSNLIDGYVGNGELQRAVLLYEQVRASGKPPSISCYDEILGHLISTKDAQMTLYICVDALDLGHKLDCAEHGTFNDAIRLLCRYGKIQDARDVVKKGFSTGLEPSVAVLNEIVSEYCEQANFEDALGLFHEIRRTPSVEACHKMLHSFCKKFGTAESDQMLLELKYLGFIPDEVTYGILIGWNCHYGQLKYAFFYLSEMLSRGLLPHLWSYNAIIAALFKEGMCKEAHTVFLEVNDRGLKLQLPTYEVMLAGYCKARQFEEVKAIIREMADRGLIKFGSLEDPLRKAFEVLRFSPSSIRVVRDNNAGFSLAEFYDKLGNGLYLQTDEDEYDSRLAEVLNNSVTLDFNALVTNEISNGSLKKSLALSKRASQWGQEISSSTLTSMIREVKKSVSHIKSVIHLLEKMPKLYNELNHEALNWLLQAYCEKGFIHQGESIVEVMLQRKLTICDISYSAFLTCLREKGIIKSFQTCWNNARAGRWLSNIKEVEPLVVHLLEHNMLNEVLEFRESLVVVHFDMRADINLIFTQKLCELGYTCAAHALLQRIQDDGHTDHLNAYNYITEGFIKENHISEALRIYEEMLSSNMHPSFSVSLLLIPHLCMNNQLDKVSSLEISCLQSYPSESSVIYETVIKGLSKAGKTEKAAAKVYDMLMVGVSPDSEIFNILIRNCCQAVQLAKALQFFGAMIRRNASLEIPSFGKLVNLLCVKGNVLQSLKLREFMVLESDHAILPISNILLFYLFKTCNSSYAEKILGEFSKREIPVDKVTYDYLVQGHFRCGDAYKSLAYLKTMISKNLKPSSRSLLMAISFLCEENMFERALSLIREIEFRGWILSSSIQYKLADGLLNQNRIHDAEIFLDQIAEKRLIGENIDYNSLIMKFCTFGRLKKAVDLIDIMLRRGFVPDLMAYESLIHELCFSGKLDQALDFHAEMLDFNIRPSVSTWDVLIQNSCKFGMAVQAENLQNALVQMGEVPSRNMYCSIVEKYRSENNLVKASSILHKMHQYGYNPEFGIQWSLISNLTNPDLRTGGKADTRFLSNLLSESGFSHGKKPNSLTR